MSNAIVLEDLGKTQVIRFNRPEIRSPLSAFVIEELYGILERLETDSRVAGIVFAGREGVFASGADLREIAGLTPATAAGFAWLGQGLMRRIEGSGKGVIAAIDGFCFGGALDLALSCGKRIASSRSSFSHPGANLGIMTGWGGTQRLPRLIGEARALEMLFTARKVEGGEALRIGLIDEISENPVERARELIEIA